MVTENKDDQSNEVVIAFGSLSNEIAASFEKTQVFGLVDGKNHLHMMQGKIGLRLKSFMTLLRILFKSWKKKKNKNKTGIRRSFLFCKKESST